MAWFRHTLRYFQCSSLSAAAPQSFIPTRNAPCTHPRGLRERFHTKPLLPSGTHLRTSSITLSVQAITSSAALATVDGCRGPSKRWLPSVPAQQHIQHQTARQNRQAGACLGTASQAYPCGSREYQVRKETNPQSSNRE